jgi:8-oxo-dGTP diphosphatase
MGPISAFVVAPDARTMNRMDPRRAVNPSSQPDSVVLVERSVIACFLRYGDQICLLKRSQAVGSAVGRWHCVSGFLEPGMTPLGQALTEIHEETGLVGDALRLVRSPESIRIERPAQGWVWVIHPFLFDVATPELRLDWEHDAYRWADPTELNSEDCVSWLARVWTLLDDSVAANSA